MPGQILEPLLPAGRPPPEGDAAAHRAWREQLQQALVCALDEVQATFACTGQTAGTTVTIVIQVGGCWGFWSLLRVCMRRVGSAELRRERGADSARVHWADCRNDCDHRHQGVWAPPCLDERAEAPYLPALLCAGW